MANIIGATEEVPLPEQCEDDAASSRTHSSMPGLEYPDTGESNPPEGGSLLDLNACLFRDDGADFVAPLSVNILGTLVSESIPGRTTVEVPDEVRAYSEAPAAACVAAAPQPTPAPTPANWKKHSAFLKP